MNKIYANNFATLALGRRGENLARQVVFDISDLESLYGSGSVEVIYKRPGDSQPYPLAVQMDGTLVTWDVTATDTEMSDGYGKCELRYYVGETLAKSKIWRTWVDSALDTPSDTAPPAPEQGWVEQVVAAGVDAKQAAERAENAVVHAPIIGDNGNWFVWDFDADKYMDTGVAASGGSSAVSSVNGKTGAVELTSEDVGAATAERVERLAGEVGGKITAPATASVGQTIVVKAVDDTGKPTEWEAADMAAGGEWVLLGDTTVDTAFDIFPTSIEGGVVTIDPTSEGYDQLINGTNYAAIIRKDFTVKDFSAGAINCRLTATDYANGIFNLIDGDNRPITTTYDVSNYKIALKKITSISMSGIGQFKRYRMKYTSPYSCTHGLRTHFMCNLLGLSWDSDLATSVSGGIELTKEIYPYMDGSEYVYERKGYVSSQNYAGSIQRNIETLDLRPASYGIAPSDGVITFTLGTDIFYRGTRIQVWGSNQV